MSNDRIYNSLKAQTQQALQNWGRLLVCQVLGDRTAPDSWPETYGPTENPLEQDSPWENLPLKRQASDPTDPAYPLVYTCALFPWLARTFPHLGESAAWECQTIAALPHWQGELQLELLPQHGLKVRVSGTAIVANLRQWLQECLPPECCLTDSVRQRLYAKTGDGCELHYYSDRCRQLQSLAQRQGWLPAALPWGDLTWQTSFQEYWTTDSTARSLLAAWSDHTDALLYAQQRLVTGIPQFLRILEQYDRAHAWSALAQTVPSAMLWGHFALLAASQHLLHQVLTDCKWDCKFGLAWKKS